MKSRDHKVHIFFLPHNAKQRVPCLLVTKVTWFLIGGEQCLFCKFSKAPFVGPQTRLAHSQLMYFRDRLTLPELGSDWLQSTHVFSLATGKTLGHIIKPGPIQGTRYWLWLLKGNHFFSFRRENPKYAFLLPGGGVGLWSWLLVAVTLPPSWQGGTG